VSPSDVIQTLPASSYGSGIALRVRATINTSVPFVATLSLPAPEIGSSEMSAPKLSAASHADPSAENHTLVAHSPSRPVVRWNARYPASNPMKASIPS
jgi:hypothetical protein